MMQFKIWKLYLIEVYNFGETNICFEVNLIMCTEFWFAPVGGFSIQCLVFSVKCSVFSIQGLVFSVQCSVCYAQCAVYSVLYAVCCIHYSVCSVQSAGGNLSVYRQTKWSNSPSSRNKPAVECSVVEGSRKKYVI